MDNWATTLDYIFTDYGDVSISETQEFTFTDASLDLNESVSVTRQYIVAGINYYF
jgi:hypothetical protein